MAKGSTKVKKGSAKKKGGSTKEKKQAEDEVVATALQEATDGSLPSGVNMLNNPAFARTYMFEPARNLGQVLFRCTPRLT